jgi:adenylylsulfate kinase
VSRFRESHSRSVAKALSWRVIASTTTTVITWIVTGRIVQALWVGSTEFVAKIGLFWAHERVWDLIRYGRHEVPPTVIWFTGLSGSGKSTISQRVTEDLRRRGLRVEHLDGDSVRSIFPATGFTRPDRDAHVRRVGFLASRLEQHGVYVVASFVSPYRESRDFVRGLCTRFVEVFVSTPLEECERRDVKGLYAKARRGEIPNFTGISDPYEAPERAEIVVDTTQVSVDEAVQRVLSTVQDMTGAR